jgi:hypothetical protein
MVIQHAASCQVTDSCIPMRFQLPVTVKEKHTLVRKKDLNHKPMTAMMAMPKPLLECFR